MRMSVLFIIIVYPKITIDSVTMSHILSCSRGPHPAEAYVSEVQLMKNLKKQKIKNAAALAACIVLAACAASASYVLSGAEAAFIRDNLTIFNVVVTVVFLIAALVVFRKNIRSIVITQAMSANASRLRSDRLSYPAGRQDFSAEAISEDLKNAGFELGESGGYITAEKKGRNYVAVIIADFKDEASVLDFCEHMPLPEHRRGFNVCVPCLLGSGYDEQAVYRSKDVRSISGGCLLPVYCDAEARRGYYMGGSCGRRSPEAVAQRVIKEIILQHPEPYPPKTDADVTDEERRFEAVDIECVLRGVNSPTDQDIAVAEGLSDGQFCAAEDGQGRGRAYYKNRGRTIAHGYSRTGSVCVLDDLRQVYYCTPKVRSASITDVKGFCAAFKAYCDKNGLSCRSEEN